MSNWAEWRGSSLTVTDLVTETALSRFRATIDAQAGDDVPQGFHWCLCLPDTPTSRLGPDGHPQNGGFLPPFPLLRRMWAGSDVQFLAPIPASAAIERRSTVAEVTEKSGKTGTLVFVEVDHLTCANGVEAVRERQTIVYREAAAHRADLPPVGAVDLGEWDIARNVLPDPTMLFRFSALTFNTHRIHYDLPYAQEVELYPGLVVHGPLMATLLLDLVARRWGPDAVTRFSFKAISPAFGGQPLHLVMRGKRQIELRAIGADGRTVMSATATRNGS